MPRLSTMQWALLVSVGVHAALLGVRIVDPEGFNRMFEDTPLEVVLVNARSKEAPAKAQAIAQANLEGGGELEKGRATSPLQASTVVELGESIEESHRQIEELQEQQRQLLVSLRRQIAAMPAPDPKRESHTKEGRAQAEQRRQLLKHAAEIEKRINEENARPKKHYISPSTREEVYAVYYDSLRRRIEERGTTNFPEAAGRKLYGELTMILTVNHDGHVLGTEVVESSGNRLLDRRAATIARAAGPFGRFSSAMRRKADEIVVVSRFKFTHDDTLETKMTSR